MKKKVLVAVVGLAAVTGVLTAQAKKKYPILQPQMTVEGSSYAKPMGALGEKPSEPWTNTTMAASVDMKPLPGKIVTMKGEIVEFSCYLQVGKRGEKHRACGQKCVNSGQPVGLLTEDGNLYMLMEEEHDPRRDGLTQSAFRKAAADHMAHIMEVTGTLASHAGYSALYVQGFVKK
ncbi:MAG: hypothetical protein SFV18_07525 [Bryobacteraceae bacterium]|nr:hypothetical protein [Bryobacteraceae bacterium]